MSHVDRDHAGPRVPGVETITSRDPLEPGDDWPRGGMEFSLLTAGRLAVLVGWIQDVLSEPTLTSLQLDRTHFVPGGGFTGYPNQVP